MKNKYAKSVELVFLVHFFSSFNIACFVALYNLVEVTLMLVKFYQGMLNIL